MTIIGRNFTNYQASLNTTNKKTVVPQYILKEQNISFKHAVQPADVVKIPNFLTIFMQRALKELASGKNQTPEILLKRTTNQKGQLVQVIDIVAEKVGISAEALAKVDIKGKIALLKEAIAKKPDIVDKIVHNKPDFTAPLLTNALNEIKAGKTEFHEALRKKFDMDGLVDHLLQKSGQEIPKITISQEQKLGLIRKTLQAGQEDFTRLLNESIAFVNK